MSNLTQSQTDLLQAAISDPSGTTSSVFPAATVRALIKRGFLISIPQADGPSRLLITSEGRQAMGAPAHEEQPKSDPDDADIEPPVQAPDIMPRRPMGKIGVLIDLLGAEGGATIEAMMAATGWQAHSVRGAIAGAIKKGLGRAVESSKAEGARVYRLADGSNV